jgi:cysteine desulfurase
VIYLNNQEFTQPNEEILKAQAAFGERYWLPYDAPHELGEKSHRLLCQALEQVYSSLSIPRSSKLWVAPSYQDLLDKTFCSWYSDIALEYGRNQIAIDRAFSFFSAPHPYESLRWESHFLKIDKNGQIDKQAFWESLKPRVSLACLSWADGWTGVIQPLWDLVRICREKEVLCLIDGSAILGKIFLRLEDWQENLVLFQSHSLHGPKGAALVVGSQTPLSLPQLQEPFYEGKEVAIVGWGLTAQKNSLYFDHLSMEGARLRDHLERGIVERVPSAQVLFAETERLPHCTLISFPSIHAEALSFFLQGRKVYVGAGKGQAALTQRLLKMGIEPSLACSALSFSLSYYTTQEEIDRAIEEIVQGVRFLETMSRNLS